MNLQIPKCTYCNESGHFKFSCNRLRTDTNNKQVLLTKSNIPFRYWGSNDPIKQLLLNETIRGFVIRNKYYKTPFIGNF